MPFLPPYPIVTTWPPLTQNLSYSQNDIDLVSSIGNLGGYSAFSGGLLFDAYGPLVAGSVGVALMLIGSVACLTLLPLSMHELAPFIVTALGRLLFLGYNVV